MEPVWPRQASQCTSLAKRTSTQTRACTSGLTILYRVLAVERHRPQRHGSRRSTRTRLMFTSGKSPPPPGPRPPALRDPSDQEPGRCNGRARGLLPPTRRARPVLAAAFGCARRHNIHERRSRRDRISTTELSSRHLLKSLTRRERLGRTSARSNVRKQHTVGYIDLTASIADLLPQRQLDARTGGVAFQPRDFNEGGSPTRRPPHP